MTTTEELRTRLDTLEAEHDAIYRELAPKAASRADGIYRWRDVDLAAWFRCANADPVRERIISELQDFLVDDDCRVALLTVTQIIALSERDGFRAPRMIDLQYLQAEICVVSEYLSELRGK